MDPELCSPYDFWQYWRNTPDAQVGRFLKLFTFLPLEEIRRLQNLSGQELNEAKEILANEVTSIVHSPEEAEKASRTAKNTFEKGMLDSGLPETILSAEEIDFRILVGSIPGKNRSSCFQESSQKADF